MAARGIVYLVGAGPGDPNLITLKGLETLKRADAVFYDRLASPLLLKNCRPGCEKIYVGKEKGRHTVRQDSINEQMVARAAEGKTVVRLKGGDPFVFGRGGEEAEALAAAGTLFEIVPGVTSSIAVPAYAGIPVTHRERASSFAVISGAEAKTKENTPLDWGKIATGVDTIVFMMGVTNLPNIVERLIENGRAPQTPVAMIQWGATPEQRTAVGTLETICEVVEREGLSHPAVVVVGDAVGLREAISWYESRPLFGKRVLVTRSRKQSESMMDLLEANGAQAIEFPVIRSAPPADTTKLDEAIRSAGTYDILTFTSANGVEAFFERVAALKMDIRDLKGPAIFAVGPTTAAALEEKGLIVQPLPEKFTGEDLGKHIESLGGPDGLKGKRALLPQADIARKALADALAGAGADVHAITAYCTVMEPETDETALQALEEGKIDAVVFTSGSTAENFLKKTESVDRGRIDAIQYFSIGPATTKKAEELGLKIAATAEEHTIEGLVETLIETLGGDRPKRQK